MGYVQIDHLLSGYRSFARDRGLPVFSWEVYIFLASFDMAYNSKDREGVTCSRVNGGPLASAVASFADLELSVSEDSLSGL